MFYDDRKMAGLLLYVGSAQFLIGLMAAAAVDPGYSIRSNFISDLGVRAGATIFNGSIIVLGLLILLAAYFLQRVTTKLWFTILVMVAGIGAMGVGVFNENAGDVHGVFSLIAFVGAGLSAIATFRFTKPPFAYLSILFGLISLVSLGLFLSGNYLGLGKGGMERMIVLPVLAWALAFGGYLIAPVEHAGEGGPTTG